MACDMLITTGNTPHTDPLKLRSLRGTSLSLTFGLPYFKMSEQGNRNVREAYLGAFPTGPTGSTPYSNTLKP